MSYLYNHAAGVNVNLSIATAQNTGGSGFDTLRNIENLEGTNFNDTLTGDGNANSLQGGNGTDSLDGGAGTWLRMRTDVKKMPASWLAMRLANAEKAKGKKLSARERREL